MRHFFKTADLFDNYSSKTLFFALLWSISPFAAPECDMGVKAQSFGSAFRAVANAEDIIFYNPAGLIKHRRTGADFFYQLAMNESFHRVGALVGDAKTSAWGLGLGYVAGIDKKTDRPFNHMLYAALAMPIVSDMFALGTTFSYFYDQARDSDLNSHFFNMDAAFMVNAPMGLSFAVVADHLLTKKGREKPMGLSVASAFDFKEISEELPLILSFDWLMQDVQSETDLGHVLASGMEYKAFSVVPLRFGFKSLRNSNDNFLSLGSGFISDNFSVDGVYQQHLSIGKIRNFGLSLSLRI